MNRPTVSEVVRPLRLVTLMLVIATLYFAREILIPAALAILFTFLLYPPVNRLRRLGLPRVLAVAIVVTASIGLSGAVGYVVTRQVVDLTERLPDYQENLRAKVREIRTSGSGKLAKVTETLTELKRELATSQPATAAVMPVPGSVISVPEPAPLKVDVVGDEPDLSTIAASVAAPLFIPLAQAAITILLVIFILLHADNIRERLITIAGMRQISLTTAAVDEAGTRIGGFLRMQALVNACYGLMVAVGLSVFGVPNALLWGVLGMLLRFVPYLGPWIAAAMPTLLAFAVFPGWARPIGVIAMFCVVELITNMILEPWLYGSSAGISSLGVVLAAVFWAWIWGPVGMILAVPITACLVVMGKHFPQLSLLHQLFGCDVDVPSVGSLYQRLLVGDEDSAEEMVESHIRDNSLVEACDSLLLPALSELKRDAAAGLIQPGQVRRAIAIMDMVCDLRAAAPARDPALVCIAGHDEIDAAAARLLARAAEQAGIQTETISSHALSNEAAQRAADSGAEWICIVQVPPHSSLHLRRLSRAVRARLGDSARVIELCYGSARAGRSDAHDDRPTARRESTVASVLRRLKEHASVPREPARPQPVA